MYKIFAANFGNYFKRLKLKQKRSLFIYLIAESPARSRGRR